MTDIVCKCGTSRLEDVQCAECGAYFRMVHPPETLDEAMHELKRALDDVIKFAMIAHSVPENIINGG